MHYVPLVSAKNNNEVPIEKFKTLSSVDKIRLELNFEHFLTVSSLFKRHCEVQAVFTSAVLRTTPLILKNQSRGFFVHGSLLWKHYRSMSCCFLALKKWMKRFKPKKFFHQTSVLRNFFGLVSPESASLPSRDRLCSCSSLITAAWSSSSSSAYFETKWRGFEPWPGCKLLSELDRAGKLGLGDNGWLSSVDWEFVRLASVGLTKRLPGLVARASLLKQTIVQRLAPWLQVPATLGSILGISNNF